MDRVILNKVEIIDRCIKRISEVYTTQSALQSNFDLQDVVILNIQRAAQAAIDLALHVVRVQKLGVPQMSVEAFELLEKNAVINPDMADKLKKMVGFRNIAIHEYTKLDMGIVGHIVENDLQNLQKFSQLLLQLV